MKPTFAIALFLLISSNFLAQLTQNVRGEIVDAESQAPLAGATVIIVGSDPMIGTMADSDGNFVIRDMLVGRMNFKVQMLGYEDLYLNQIALTSGKELYLKIELKSQFETLEVVEIKDDRNFSQPLNEMATLSARSFSVEETQRYAASAYDPARMALAFSGVSTAGDDIMNEISVRGNSPRGILWRLEGIEIPNPNHFGSLGSSGGGISMLSSSTLSHSDFYTGAFPSEFGNATSGVFDLYMRNGNNEVREHSFMIGLLGVEASTEGYFNQHSNASYLLNYRYSTFALLSKVYNPIGDVIPFYQDFSFKLNFPQTPIGSVSVFGLGGDNHNTEEAESDSTLWEDDIDNLSFRSDQQVGIIGIKNVIRLHEKAYVKNIAAYSINRYEDISYEYDLNDFNNRELFDITNFEDDQFALNSTLNYKLNNRNTFKTGLNASFKSYNLMYDNRDLDTDIWTTYIDSKGRASQFDLFAHWKYRFNERLTGHSGLHFTYLPFNSTYSIEHRLATEYNFDNGNQVSFAIGLHSKPEHISTYFLEHVENGVNLNQAKNKNLEIPKSIHAVTGYQTKLNERTSISLEAYFQYHYDIPVEALDTSVYSIINAIEIWSIVGTQGLTSKGRGRNYGVDLSIQRTLNNRFYYMGNASIYKSEYRTYRGQWFNSRFNGDYILNFTTGKEWKLKNQAKSIGLNAKFLATGGNRITPVNIESSVVTGEGVYDLNRVFDEHAGNYLRLDLGIAYKINRKNSTHSLLIDIQNVTNKQNLYTKYFNEDELRMESVYQLGVFPFLNYRIEFQGKSRSVK